MATEFVLHRSRQHLAGGQEPAASEVVLVDRDLEPKPGTGRFDGLERFESHLGPYSVAADHGQSVCHGRGVYETK